MENVWVAAGRACCISPRCHRLALACPRPTAWVPRFHAGKLPTPSARVFSSSPCSQSVWERAFGRSAAQRLMYTKYTSVWYLGEGEKIDSPASAQSPISTQEGSQEDQAARLQPIHRRQSASASPLVLQIFCWNYPGGSSSRMASLFKSPEWGWPKCRRCAPT